MASITVHPYTLRQAVRDSREDPCAIAATRAELAELPEWLDRETPFPLSFTKISQLGKALHVPFGYLVKSKVTPPAPEPLLQYRTVNNGYVGGDVGCVSEDGGYVTENASNNTASVTGNVSGEFATGNVSKNLHDLLQIMRSRQNWVRDELTANGLGANSFVGSQAGTNSPQVLGAAIRAALRLDDVSIVGASSSSRFAYVRRRASEAGFMVMIDSMVSGVGTRRRLSIEEFRAFVLLDDVAPLIFINRNDSTHAMLFSLLHEVGHVLLGSEELYNAAENDPSEYGTVNSAVERLINRAVIYALISEREFREQWQAASLVCDGCSAWDVAQEFARKYGLSALAFTIHAKELGLTTEQEVREAREQTEHALRDERLQNSNGSSGGNQNLTNAFHLDDRYVALVHDSVQRGALPFTDAISLLGVRSLKAYDGIIRAKGLAQ